MHSSLAYPIILRAVTSNNETLHHENVTPALLAGLSTEQLDTLTTELGRVTGAPGLAPARRDHFRLHWQTTRALATSLNHLETPCASASQTPN